MENTEQHAVPVDQPVAEESKKKSNFTIEKHAISVKDRKPEAVDLLTNYLNFISDTETELNDKTEHYPELDVSKGAVGRAWYNSFMESVGHQMRADALKSAVEDENRDWVQRPEFEGAKLGVGKPNFKVPEGGIVSGDAAVMMLTADLDIGANIQIPLWSSGIWVSIKSPSEARLNSLNDAISNDKIIFGRRSNGLIFSNTSVIITSHLIDCILEHVYDSTAKNANPERLKSLIKVSDLHQLVWGFMYTIEPNGYDYARPCTNDPSVCQHIVEGVIDLSKLSFTDKSALSAKQLKHMASRLAKYNDDEIREYQKEHMRGDDRTVTINMSESKSVEVILKNPNLSQYLTAGVNWVEQIEGQVEELLGSRVGYETRNTKLAEYAHLSTLRQYEHYIHAIVSNGARVEDRETLTEILEKLSSRDSFYMKLFDEIGKFIDDSMISIIALPKYTCPKCGETQEGESYSFSEHLMAINPITTFFTLLDQVTTKALTRPLK